MKKINLKLLTAILAVTLIAGVSIFYACKKGEDNNSETKLKKETEFVARINKETCVQVIVYRDEKHNVHLTTTKVSNDLDIPIGVILSETLNTEPQNAKDDEESIVIEIPNDAIYWLVPLDGNEPIKFEPINNGAKDVPGGSVKVSCTCSQGKPNCFNTGLNCPMPEKRQDKYGIYYHCPSPDANTSCCQTCIIKSLYGSAVVMGSSYIVQSDNVTINGIIYE